MHQVISVCAVMKKDIVRFLAVTFWTILLPKAHENGIVLVHPQNRGRYKRNGKRSD